MIDLLLEQIETQINGYLRLRGVPSIYKCALGDISVHDKNVEAGSEDEIMESIIISMASVEEEQALKNNYPLRQSGSTFLKEKSAIYINVYILFAAKYASYDTALKAISNIIYFFQTHRRISFAADEQAQEAVLNLHNIGFENLNNLWTVLGGRYLPSVMYKARLLMYQAAPPLGGSVIVEIEENESLS